MDFTHPRLKLRVAVCPFNATSIADYNNRVVGMKREASVLSAPVIFRQFLLLLPVDTTFSELVPLVKAQYQKLYQSQPGFTKMNKIILFRDSNQCDLDLDYVVAEICASNDLIYVMAEMEDLGNKKMKLSVPENQANQAKITITPKNSPAKPTGNNQTQISDKKVPEFKPTPIKTPTAKQQPNPSKIQTKNPFIETKSSVINTVKSVVADPVIDLKSNDPVVVNTPTEPVIAEIKQSNTADNIENTIKSTTTDEIRTDNNDRPIQNDTSNAVMEVKIPEPVSVKAPKKIRQPKAKPVEVVETKQKVAELKVESVIPPSVPSTYSEIAEKQTISNPPNSVITPVPTPISTVFIPRKAESKSDDDSSSDGEDGTNLNSFDTANLFGPQVITSEPRRSDAFVLFAAGTTDEDSSNEETGQRSIVSPLKKPSYSSIVSLQATPSSSEIDEDGEEDDDEEDEVFVKIHESQKLPQSVTLRRLSSVSPIPDPSEIPSLNELRDSITRIPTPTGRPSKKQQNSGGRPKKQNLAKVDTNNNINKQ